MVTNATIRALSYSLYGSSPRYCRGMVHAARRADLVFPDWQVWIYHDHSVPKRTLQTLGTMSHVRLIDVVRELPDYVHRDWNPATWRFWIASDPTVDAYAVRDADALPSAREFAAVQEWLQSQRAFHIMRDHPMHHPTHFAPMLAGMWGGRGHRAVPHMHRLLRDHSSNHTGLLLQQYGQDQDFLWNHILPLAYRDVLQHDSYFCRESNGIAFPMTREDSVLDDRNPFWFVGNMYARNNRIGKDMRLVKAEARYRACLQDRRDLEQRLGTDNFAQRVNTTYTGKLRGLSTEAWTQWSNQLYAMNMSYHNTLQAATAT